MAGISLHSVWRGFAVRKERLVGLIVSVFVSAAMGLVSAILVTTTNPDSLRAHSSALIYASNIILSIILGIVISLFIPLGKLGASLARKAGAYPPSMKFIFINAIPNSVGNTFLISLILSFVGVFTARMKIPADILPTLPPFPVMWLGSWVRLLLPTLVISYILSIILAPIVARIVGFKGPEAGPGGPPHIAAGGPPRGAEGGTSSGRPTGKPSGQPSDRTSGQPRS